MPGTTHLLYLHGFRSSPASAKARCMAAWLAAHRPDVHGGPPQPPPPPAATGALLQQGLATWPLAEMAVVGSSLGGFYATAGAEATGCPAVLLNPAVNPARDLARHTGMQTQFHAPDEIFFFDPAFIDELRALTVPAITRPQRYAAVIAQGDEVLSWQEMTGRYPGAHIRLLPGSDHALSDFDHHLPFVLEFLQLCD